MRRAIISLALGLTVGSAAEGQSSMRTAFEDMFRFGTCGEILCISAPGHGSHFVPATVEGNATVLSFITNAVGANASNLPISATTSGVTYTFERGLPVQSTLSSGPIFGERAQTLGKGRSFGGANVSYLSFTKLRGTSLDDLVFNFTHEDTPPAGLGNPDFENDVIQVRTRMELKLLVTSFFLTYGVTDRIDVGVAVPVVSAKLEGESRASVHTVIPNSPHFFGGTSTDPDLSAVKRTSASATGIGDVALRLKATLGSPSASTAFALLGDVRLPTGSEEDFHGTGGMTIRGSAIASSRIGNFSPHVNVGYASRAGDFQTNALLATAGFDQLLTSRATFAFDVISEFQVGENKLTLPSPVVVAGTPVDPSNIPGDKKSDFVNASFGLKVSTPAGLTGVFNALVPLQSGSLRPNSILTIGLEYGF
jgi:hypothetical protein